MIQTDTEAFELHDLVNLPFDEVGLIVDIVPTLWGYPYRCKILISTLSDEGAIGDFRATQMSKLDFRSSKAAKLMEMSSAISSYMQKQKKLHRKQQQDAIASTQYDIDNAQNALQSIDMQLKDYKLNGGRQTWISDLHVKRLRYLDLYKQALRKKWSTA